MRIIAGTAGRTAIKVPSHVTRPTTDFVRQAIFSILGETIHQAHILDLYAGSGALGLEALSRGAASCTFVETNKKATTIIQQNLTATRLTNAHIHHTDVHTFLARDHSTYDIIFADPPYQKNLLDPEHINTLLTQKNLHPRLQPHGIFYAEISTRTPSPEHPDWQLIDRRQYGSSAILLYRPAQTT